MNLPWATNGLSISIALARRGGPFRLYLLLLNNGARAWRSAGFAARSAHRATAPNVWGAGKPRSVGSPGFQSVCFPKRVDLIVRGPARRGLPVQEGNRNVGARARFNINGAGGGVFSGCAQQDIAARRADRSGVCGASPDGCKKPTEFNVPWIVPAMSIQPPITGRATSPDPCQPQHAALLAPPLRPAIAFPEDPRLSTSEARAKTMLIMARPCPFSWVGGGPFFSGIAEPLYGAAVRHTKRGRWCAAAGRSAWPSPSFVHENGSATHQRLRGTPWTSGEWKKASPPSVVGPSPTSWLFPGLVGDGVGLAQPAPDHAPGCPPPCVHQAIEKAGSDRNETRQFIARKARPSLGFQAPRPGRPHESAARRPAADPDRRAKARPAGFLSAADARRRPSVFPSSSPCRWCWPLSMSCLTKKIRKIRRQALNRRGEDDLIPCRSASAPVWRSSTMPGLYVQETSPPSDAEILSRMLPGPRPPPDDLHVESRLSIRMPRAKNRAW